MVWIFFLSTNRNFFQRNQLGASTLGPELQRNSIHLFQIESSGTFLTSHISAMLYHIVSEASMVWIFFLIRSIPMVWIFFLSTNRNFFQRNQLGASTLGPELQRNSIHLFQIESSGTFLTSHISAMLYHIVSEASKFGQFRWSGFFSYQQTGTFFNGINYEHPPSDRNRIDTPSIFPNRIFWNFSHEPHFRNAIPHSVRSVKIRSVPMVWIFFLSTNRNFFQRNQLGHPPSDRNCKETPSIFSKSNLLELFSQATFPQCYIT